MRDLERRLLRADGRAAAAAYARPAPAPSNVMQQRPACGSKAARMPVACSPATRPSMVERFIPQTRSRWSVARPIERAVAQDDHAAVLLERLDP